MRTRFDRFLAALACTDVSGSACNQYSRTAGDRRGNALRRRNLRLYLSEMGAVGPRVLLIGEAVSHRGGRLSGIAFVSEIVMLAGVGIASPPHHILGAESGYRKATAGDRLSTEASATMVWETIRHIDPLPLLWNAFPFHPFHHGEPLSNRVPSAAELATGSRFIHMLLRLFPIEQVVAVGNQAAASLTLLGIEHDKVRHPSMGGKQSFVDGMARLSQSSQTMKKSQIQEIKEGKAMRTRTYSGRLQPFGPKAPLPTKNAVRLSTVPSSAKEKFDGGKDE